jgi:hypothetical protein
MLLPLLSLTNRSVRKSQVTSVLLADGNGTDRVFDSIVVDGERSRFGIARQRCPALECMLNGLAGTATDGDSVGADRKLTHPEAVC